MKYWTRTTHNFNNETREWDFKKELEYVKFPEKTPLAVHALDSGRWSSFKEIKSENLEYCAAHNCVIPSDKEILEELAVMEKLGLVKSKGK